MNYARIYAEFIAARTANPPGHSEYAERHHIKPRALGGGDEPENLVRLRPEDHLFAHLLLAKIHGGKMWAPIALMVGLKRYGERKRYGWAVRAMASSKTGALAYQFDARKHVLHHVSGARWVGLQNEIPAALGVSSSFANMLLQGKVKSAKGWSLPGVVGGKASGNSHPGYDPEVFTLHHVDGRVITGTRLELHKKYGIPRPSLSVLLLGQQVVRGGWHLPGAEIPLSGAARKWAKRKAESCR